MEGCSPQLRHTSCRLAREMPVDYRPRTDCRCLRKAGGPRRRQPDTGRRWHSACPPRPVACPNGRRRRSHIRQVDLPAARPARAALQVGPKIGAERATDPVATDSHPIRTTHQLRQCPQLGAVDPSPLSRFASLPRQSVAESPPRVGRPQTWIPRALPESLAETPVCRRPLFLSPSWPRASPVTDRMASVVAVRRSSTMRWNIEDARATKSARPRGSESRPAMILARSPILRPSSEPSVALQMPVWAHRVPRCGRGTSVPPPCGDTDKQRPPIRRQSTAGLGRVGVALDRFPAEGDDGPVYRDPQEFSM